jgi:hypothetical protein
MSTSIPFEGGTASWGVQSARECAMVAPVDFPGEAIFVSIRRSNTSR